MCVCCVCILYCAVHVWCMHISMFTHVLGMCCVCEFYVCLCVRVLYVCGACLLVCGCMYWLCVSRPEEDTRYLPLFSTLLPRANLTELDAHWARLVSNLQGSVCPKCWDYRHTPPWLTFNMVLGIWTMVFTLAQEALLPTELKVSVRTAKHSFGKGF